RTCGRLLCGDEFRRQLSVCESAVERTPDRWRLPHRPIRLNGRRCWGLAWVNIKTRLIQGIPPAPGLGTVEQPMDYPDAQTKIDALVVKFFSAFDNRGGARPRLEHIVECFTEKATIVRRS